MTIATIAKPQAAAAPPDTRRITEDDADFLRIKARTIRQLHASIRQLVRDLRAGHNPGSAQSAFDMRHIALMRAAYIAAHEEGQRDYWQQFSATPHKQPIHEPDETRLRQTLAFYAPSVAKMALEATHAYQAAPNAHNRLSDAYRGILLDEAQLKQWEDSLDVRVTLQADLSWAAMNDGYVGAGGKDGAAPYQWLYWQLGPVKTFHCSDCPALAAFSPYGRPGSGQNELYQTPGDGRTPCGAGCKCTLSYGFNLEAYENLLNWRDSVFPPEIAGTSTVPLQPALPPQDPADMTQGQIRALDGFRAAQEQWQRANQETLVRGNIISSYQQAQHAFEVATAQSGHDLPPLPNLFTLSSQYRNEESLAAALRSWTLTEEQHAALTRAYEALVDWNDATAAMERTYEVAPGALDAEAYAARQPADLAQQIEEEQALHAAQSIRPIAPTTVRYDSEAAHVRMTHVFPTDPTDEQISNLAGAPPGSTVEVDRTRQITVTAPDGTTTTTMVFPRAAGETGPEMINWRYEAPDGSNRINVDLVRFAQQVREANALGIARIHMKSRDMGVEGSKFPSTDYWRLPQLGYDTTMKSILGIETRSAVLPPGLEDVVMLSDLLATPAGRAWWLQNGLYPGLDFEVQTGSYSWRVLDALLRSLGLEGL